MQKLITKLLLILYLGGIALASLLPSSTFPTVKTVGMDKIVHVGMYFVLTILLYFATSLSARIKNSIKEIAWLTLYPIAYGGLMEILQMITPSRSASWADMVANCIGVVLAVIIILILKRLKR